MGWQKPAGRLRVCVGLMYARHVRARIDGVEPKTHLQPIRPAHRKARTWQAWSARSDARHVRARIGADGSSDARVLAAHLAAPGRARADPRAVVAGVARVAPAAVVAARRREGPRLRDLRPPPLDREPGPIKPPPCVSTAFSTFWCARNNSGVSASHDSNKRAGNP